MAFLNPVRLVFAGRFQADVSTVNNDVRHYDDAEFRPNFQELGTKANPNGWWNPTGSGAYRFVGCRVTGAGYADGTWVSEPASDPVIGATIGGAADRTAGKLVDIDPQWQLASAPWGLAVRLLSGTTELLGGEYKSNAFRDLWFSRNVNAQADSAASSTFQSVLEGVVFDESALARSRALRELREATFGDRLSIRLSTFGYDGNAASPNFTLGTMVGTIGPYLEGEPESFVFGRRFAPASGFQSYGAGITYFSGLLDGASRTLLLDLSNALQISDARGEPVDIGELSVGVLTDDSVVENTPVTADNLVPLGAIPYRDAGWLAATGGVVALRLSQEQYDLAAEHPLALVYDAPFNPGGTGEGNGHGVVAIRETVGGLFAGAEPAVHRIDAGGESEVTFWASRYGAPLDGQQVLLRQVGPVPDQGAGTSSPDVNDIPIPDMGTPMEALTVPDSVTTASGRGAVVLRAGDPGNPRKYLDGQVYLVDYRLPGQSNTSRQPFDFVVVHVRDAYDVPEHPTWERDVKPILTQYGNLYPVMSKGFIDLGDRAAVLANRDLLSLSFSRPMTDPNHMPVTRDLSDPKRQMLLAWLANPDEPQLENESAEVVVGHRPATPASSAAAQADPDFVNPMDSKTRFAKSFLRAGRGSRDKS
jgi:hypothetical protein